MLAATLGLIGGATLAPDQIGIADVRQAIDAIGAAIVAAHHPTRHWDPKRMPEGESTRQHVGGYTALATLALITAGHDPQESPLRQAIERLQGIDPDGTYAVSFRAQVWASLPDRFRPDLQRDIDRIIESFHWEQGGWDYLCRPVKRIPRVSPSTRHVAVLALHAAAMRGIPIPRPLLERIQQATIDSQHEDGGWSYYEDDTPTGSMTAAGVFSLVLVDDLLHATGRRRANAARDTAIARGLQWLDARFEAAPCPGGGRCAKFPMYWLYSLERVALATGTRTLNDRDWLREAVAEVLDRLCRPDASGGWTVKGRQSLSQLRQRCFALMILHRASLPLACSALDIDTSTASGEAAAGLVARLLDSHEQETIWQRVSMDDDVAAWLESPLLLISATSPPRFLKKHYGALARHDRSPDTVPPPTIPQVDRVREYVRRGGMLVVVAASSGAIKAWRRIGSLAAPHASWTRLDSDHPALTLLSRPKRQPRAEMLWNGLRPLLCIVSRNAEGALPNLWAFATERHPFPPRVEHGRVSPGVEASGMASSVVFVESPAGGVEPGAADAFQVWARRTGRPATVHHVTLDTALETEGLVVLQVAGPPPWTGIERLLAAGRSILCSGPREAIAAIEGAARDANLNPTPVRNQPWVKGDRLSRGGDLSRPGWNPGTRQQGRTLPTLDMVIATHPSGGRLMLSRADLTHALLDRPCWGIHGYDASTAGLLVWNLMQHIHPAESRHVAYLDADAAMGMVDNRIGGSDRDRAWGVAGALDSSAGEAPRNLQSRTGRSDGGVVLVHEPPTRRRIAPS